MENTVAFEIYKDAFNKSFGYTDDVIGIIDDEFQMGVDLLDLANEQPVATVAEAGEVIRKEVVDCLTSILDYEANRKLVA